MNEETIATSLEHCFHTAKDIIETWDVLKKNNLLSKISESIEQHSNSHARILIERTLKKGQSRINSNVDYLQEISLELAWAWITSYPFITFQSNKQYRERKNYFDSLTSAWHRYFLQGYELNYYRLIDVSYRLYLNNEHRDKLDNDIKIKHNADLCDSESIHCIALGYPAQNQDSRKKVIAFTRVRDNKELDIMRKRAGYCSQSLIDFQRDVEGWQVKAIPGEIICINIDTENKVMDKNFTRIPFNRSVSDVEDINRSLNESNPHSSRKH